MDELIGTNHKTRRTFSCTVYLITVLFLIVALTQWLIVNTIESLTNVFKKYEWISVILFFLAIVLFMVFIFFEKTRTVTFVNWLITLIIVESIIIGLFALVVVSPWQDLVLWFCICVLMEFLFILIGIVIPLDITMFIVTLFVVAFLLIIVSVLWIVLYVLYLEAHYFLLYQSLLSSVTLTFVIYHAQTITGGRFAEMRVTDYLLASLILYFDFIVLFLMTFYVQTKFHVAAKGL